MTQLYDCYFDVHIHILQFKNFVSASSHWQSSLVLYFPWPPISLRAVVKANPRPPGGFLVFSGFWDSSSASRPKAFTSLRLRKVGPLLIWTMTYLPGVSLPGERQIVKRDKIKSTWFFFFTWDDNMLWVSSGTLKSSKQGASWKLLLGRSWQLVGDAHLHLLRSLPPFSPSVENINPLNIYSFSVVDGQPWVRFFFRVTERILFSLLVRSYVAIDAPGGKNFVSNPDHLVIRVLPTWQARNAGLDDGWTIGSQSLV